MIGRFPVPIYHLFCLAKNRQSLLQTGRTLIFIKAPAGQQRFNILAALNAITHELIMATNDTYTNAQSVCELLHHIAELNFKVPISFIST